MITLITGAPGTGKTAAVVSMLEELSRDRPLFVSGVPDLKAAHAELADPSQWPSVVPDGAVVVIDEVQRVWRPRGPGSKVPESVAALETHRHRGLDFYIITQSPNLVDSAVRGLIGRHVHLRDLGMLGRWWYEWPEVADQARSAWRTAPVKRRYKLPKRIFSQYTSSVLHVKPSRRVPAAAVVLLAAVVALPVVGWQVYKRIGAGAGQAVAAPSPVERQVSVPQQAVLPAPVASLGGVAPDERTDFVPRIGGRPWTAPAYDTVRQVVRMPQVAGAICSGERCVCVSDFGERIYVTDDQCREWLSLPKFNPYRQPPMPVVSSGGGIGAARSPSAALESAPAPAASAVSVPVPSGVSNPAAEAREVERQQLWRLARGTP